jgi:hypothetical protein
MNLVISLLRIPINGHFNSINDKRQYIGLKINANCALFSILSCGERGNKAVE